MSVNKCDRKGCNNINCDRYSDTYNWYICNNCFEEMISRKIPETLFMGVPKSYKMYNFSESYYKDIFPLINDMF